jgi:general secretion pathway protein D
MRALPTTLLLLLLIAPQAGPAQAPAPPAGAGEVKMDFKEAPIEQVIETVAKLTGKSFIYDDRVRGNVTVIAGPDVTVEEAYKIFESILQVKGFTTVPAPGGMLKIIPIREAKESPIDTVEGKRTTPDRDLFITRLIPLEYVKAETVNNTLKPLVSKDANVIAYAPTNTLILTDTATNIRRLMRIIEEIDVEIYSETIKVFPLKFADAAALAAQLGEIFGSETAAGPGPPGAPRVRPRVRPGGPDAATGDGVVGSVGEPRFIVDERTNSLITIATRAALDQIENLIEMLDYQRKGTGKVHVYRLQNADAEEMADTLSSLGQGGGGSRPRTTTPRTPTPGGVATPGAGLGGGASVADLGDGVRVTADAPTNSLIIQATPEIFSTLSEVIEALDTRRPQVLVEALIMEVDVDDSTDLGMAWLHNLETDAGGRIAIKTGGITTDPEGLIESTGPGFTSAILGKFIDVTDPDNPDGPPIQVPVISGLVRASESDSDINIVSAPVILTADNEEAEIVVGTNIPVPTSQVSTPSGVTGGNQGFDTSVNITRQDVGVTLRVTPQISEGDTVRLQIFQELSEVQEGTLDPETSSGGPITSNRKVENTVYVRDSEAVMIGGILSETQTDSVDGVPWLHRIPVLGWAFKTTRDSTRKTNLLVILTPHIVRDPDDLNRFTAERRERFRDAAREGLEYNEDELEARRKALDAGLDLPKDPNPVRRELDRHSNRYPTEELPQLRSEQQERELRRQKEIADLRAAERAGSYVVQVSFFGDSDEAARELGRLIEAGYDGTLLSQTEMGKVVHYVQLGPYLDEPQAQHVARELRANLDLHAIVVVAE